MTDGVTEYTTAVAYIHFQKGEEKCLYCPFLETYSRDMCRQTGEYIVDRRVRGKWCPLIFEEEK